LGLLVVHCPLERDPGHAEIQSNRGRLEDHLTRKKLANLFQFVTDALGGG
jgi:hypothetical protein